MALASVSLNTARALLNDTIASIWPDTVLIPFFNEAYRELQTKLKLAGCPIQMTDVVTTPVAIGTTTLDLSASRIIEPIFLYEKNVADSDILYTKMTEVSNIPNLAQTNKLNYWRWNGTLIQFLGSTAAKTVKSRIWSFYADIVIGTTAIPFVNSENYLGPRTASLAALSIKEQADGDNWGALANQSLDEIIKSNRGALNVSRP